MTLVYRWTRNLLAGLHRHEAGQTTTEYVAMTAVGVGLAISVVWLALSGALTSAVSSIAGEITAFIASI